MNPADGEKEWPRDWNPPQELMYSQPRPVRLSGGGIAVACLAALMAVGSVAAGVSLTHIARRQAHERDLLTEQGVVTVGTVTRRWIASGNDKQPWVEYSFTAGGERFTAKSKASRSVWKTLDEGSPLPVRYVPAQPGLSNPDGWRFSVLPLFVPPLTAVGLLLPAGILAFSIHRQKWLLAEGRPAQGRITELKRAPKGQTVQYYEFKTLSGSVFKGRTQSSKPLPAGSAVTVLYDPENPRRSSLYPLSLAKPATDR